MAWRPKDKALYYFIVVGTEVKVHYAYHGMSYLSDLRVKEGNCFKTEKEAKDKLKQIKAILKTND